MGYIDKVKESLLRTGISCQGYSGHSLRKGAAVSAAGKGMSKDDIKLLGRWKSNAVDSYINDVPATTLAANLLLLNTRFASLGPSRRIPPPPPLPSPTPLFPARRLARRDQQSSHRGA